MRKQLLLIALLPVLLAGCGEKTPSGSTTSSSSISSTSTSTSSGSSSSSSTTQPQMTAKQKFCSAKNATFLSDAYQYEYNLEAKLKFKDALSYSPANIKGLVQWNKNGIDTQYMAKRELSGLLLIDSTSYKYNVGTDLIRLNANENKDFSVVDHETITSSYDYEGNSIGCLLKKLEENDNLSVTKDASNRYNLSLKTSFAQDSILRVLNYIDSNKILTVLNKLTKSKWDTCLNITSYATLTSDETKINKFYFAANIEVQDTVSISLTLDQTFTSYKSDIAIELPKFENTYVTSTDIDNVLTNLNTAYDSNKMKYYKYDLKTAVDHGVSKENPLGLAVNSHSQGYAERSLIGNEVYFHNGLELDSDYKNKDQYPEICNDYKFTRAKVNNEGKEVYDVKDGLIKNTYNLIENYSNDEIDDYYMLIKKDWISSKTVKILRKTTDNDQNVTYKLGLGSDGIKEILNHYNKCIRLSSDPTKQHIDVFKINGNFDAKKADFEIITNPSGAITSIDLLLKGFYDMDVNDDVKFSMHLKIKFDYTKDTYEIPTQAKDITLPNFDIIG